MATKGRQFRLTPLAESDLEDIWRINHRDGKRTAYYRANQDMHQRIVDVAGNPVLSELYGSLMSKVHRARGPPTPMCCAGASLSTSTSKS